MCYIPVIAVSSPAVLVTVVSSAFQDRPLWAFTLPDYMNDSGLWCRIGATAIVLVCLLCLRSWQRRTTRHPSDPSDQKAD